MKSIRKIKVSEARKNSRERKKFFSRTLLRVSIIFSYDKRRDHIESTRESVKSRSLSTGRALESMQARGETSKIFSDIISSGTNDNLLQSSKTRLVDDPTNENDIYSVPLILILRQGRERSAALRVIVAFFILDYIREG